MYLSNIYIYMNLYIYLSSIYIVLLKYKVVKVHYLLNYIKYNLVKNKYAYIYPPDWC